MATAGLVGQYPITTFTTPVNGTSPINANEVRGNDNTTKTAYNSHDSDSTIHLQSSAVASRPAAGTLGRKWLSTDTDAIYLYYDDGSNWIEIDYLRNTGGTITAPVTITSATTPQFTVGYDGSNYYTTSVSSAGAVTFNATGASAGFTFSDLVTASAGVTIASGQTLTLTGATVAGAPTWSSTQSLNTSGTAATVTTAAQPAITSAANLATVGTITVGVWNGTAIITTYGGTGLTSYTAGDLPYYASGTALSKLGIGTANYVLTSSGSAPQWSSTLTGINTTGNAATATTAGTVTTAAQPAITSVGTLTALTVSGTSALAGVTATSLAVSLSQNTSTLVSVTNPNAGAAAGVLVQLTNGTSEGQLRHQGTGFTTSGIFRQNGTMLLGGGAGGLTIGTLVSQPIYFAINEVETFRLPTGGGLQFISTSAPSSLANGQVWFDGTDLKCRLGGATKTITVS